MTADKAVHLFALLSHVMLELKCPALSVRAGESFPPHLSRVGGCVGGKTTLKHFRSILPLFYLMTYYFIYVFI